MPLNDNANGPVPEINSIPFWTPLKLNGTGTKEMAVDGDPTAQNFEWEPSSNTWVLSKLIVLIQDPGSADVNDFGSITGALTNGVKIEVQSEGNTYEVAVFEDNGDLINFFSGSSVVSFSGGESAGFLDEDDTFVGEFIFPANTKLFSADNDYVRAIVRDDLTDLQFFRMSALSHRDINV